MSLYSLGFVVFMLALLAAYYATGRLLGRGQWVVLLLGSLCYYCLAGSWQTLVYVLFCAVVTWLVPLALKHMDRLCAAERKACDDRAARKRAKARWQRRKQAVMLLGLLMAFGVLAQLKYWNVILYQLGQASSPHSLGLLLPLGISFYTFQSVSYLLDVYRGSDEAETNFLRHLLFVTYFPQMIQGPINRHAELVPQLLAHHAWDTQRARRALPLIGYGMLKKFLMADLLVGPISRLLDAPDAAAMPGSWAVLAILMYSAQQYGDFSGGIDMVEGISELLGIQMAPNFRRPYFATSLADFWRRWHISLGQWMRDYVFYPVALTRPLRALGKRAGRAGEHLGRTLPACLANILVFLIVGAWHGAQAHFIVWGLYNGLVIALADLLKPAFSAATQRLGIDPRSRGWHVASVIRTFLVVNVGWYFDRVESFSLSLALLRSSVLSFGAAELPRLWSSALLSRAEHAQILLAVAMAVAVFCVSLCQERGHQVRTRLLAWPLPLRWALYAFVGLLVVATSVLHVGGGFMYANY